MLGPKKQKAYKHGAGRYPSFHDHGNGPSGHEFLTARGFEIIVDIIWTSGSIVYRRPILAMTRHDAPVIFDGVRVWGVWEYSQLLQSDSRTQFGFAETLLRAPNLFRSLYAELSNYPRQQDVGVVMDNACMELGYAPWR